MKLRKPYLEFWLDIWFISLRTELMHECRYMDVYDYIWLHVKVLGGRYGFSFHLYSPHVKRHRHDK